MKIKVKDATYSEVLEIKERASKREKIKPKKPSMFFRRLLKAVSASELKKVNFTSEKINMDSIADDEPCLFLMNHSSFIDLEIAATVLFPRPFNIVCTSDGFVGKEKLMRSIGCVPTQKFVTDSQLVHDLVYTVRKIKSSILMYPEASYSFDGTATPLPDSLGKLVKLLNIPVVMIRTYGAFHYDPLYNCLQKRKVEIKATIECVIEKDSVKTMSASEINDVIKKNFSFDNFKWQQEENIIVNEKFRADGLNRVLYKCACCKSEGSMRGKDTVIECKACGKEYELTENGFIRALNGETEFSHIPDWYSYERNSVREEIEKGDYLLDIDVSIIAMVDTSAVYRIGDGHLRHDALGFRLTGCDGQLDYVQTPLASYSLYADYYWYELGDIICIGTKDILYYCFPKTDKDIVAKTRLATEELFKLVSKKSRA